MTPDQPSFRLFCATELPPHVILGALTVGCEVQAVRLMPDGSVTPPRPSSPAELLREMADFRPEGAAPRVYLDGKGGLVYAR